MGEKEALFAKMKQLEGDEHYELCTMFKSMFDSMNLNREYRDWETDRKSTRLNSSHITRSRMPSSA